MDEISGIIIILCALLLLSIAECAGMNPLFFADVLGVKLDMGNIASPTATLLYLGVRDSGVSIKNML